jgi:hypothetical protein
VAAQPNGAALCPFSQTTAGSTLINLSLKDQGYPNTAYWVVGAFRTQPSLVLFGRKLGITGDALTIASLSFANSKYFYNFHGMLNSSGEATMSLIVPNTPFLKGTVMYFVALTWTPFRKEWLHVSNRANLTIN